MWPEQQTKVKRLIQLYSDQLDCVVISFLLFLTSYFVKQKNTADTIKATGCCKSTRTIWVSFVFQAVETSFPPTRSSCLKWDPSKRNNLKIKSKLRSDSRCWLCHFTFSVSESKRCWLDWVFRASIQIRRCTFIGFDIISPLSLLNFNFQSQWNSWFILFYFIHLIVRTSVSSFWKQKTEPSSSRL